MTRRPPATEASPETEAELSRRTFHTLDALRGIAAAIVLTRHAPTFLSSTLFPGSALAVDLFFLMSGFVIAHAYEGRLRRGLGFAAFARIRLIRLFPLYILGTAIGIAVAALSITTGIKSALIGFTWTWPRLAVSALPAALVLPAPPIPGSALSLYPLNAVAWSLAFEIFVNLLYCATFPLWTNRRLIVVVAAAAAALVASVAYFGSTDIGWNWINVLGGLPRILFSFPLGILLYRFHARGFFAREVNAAIPVAAVVLALCLPLPPPLLLLFHVAVILVAFPLIVIAAVASEPPAYLVRPFFFLGATSYAAYALQRPLMSVINGVLKALHLVPGPPTPLTGLCFLVAYFAFCWLVDLTYDKPIRRALSRSLRSRHDTTLRPSPLTS